MRFPRAPWSRTDKDQVEPLSRMEGVPIFVRIIIDIPSKESYNHINKAGGTTEDRL